MAVKFGEPIESMGPYYGEIDLNGEIDEQTKKELGAIISSAGGSLACEAKEDGFRCQPHIDKRKLTLFTRGSTTFDQRCFPEIVDSLARLNLSETILDAELKGTANGFAGFKSIQSRAKYGITSDKVLKKYLAEKVPEHPLELIVFDVMFYKGKSQIDKSYNERRKLIEDIAMQANETVRTSEQYVFKHADPLIALYQSIQHQKREGLVLKQPELAYLPGDKKHWIKLKRFETLDLALVGINKTDTHKYGQGLVASYEPTRAMFQTVGSVNLMRTNPFSGLSFSKEITDRLKQKGRIIRTPSPLVEYGKHEPDFYVDPKRTVILEINAMNIEFSSNTYACGFDGKKAYSMRIGYVKNIRDDKNPFQATPTEHIAIMHELQSR